MANNILSVIWITDQHWSYYYLLIGFLLLIICFLLYRLRQLKKNIGKEQDYYHSLFDILDNLPFPIMVKDIQNSFRYFHQIIDIGRGEAKFHRSGFDFGKIENIIYQLQ